MADPKSLVKLEAFVRQFIQPNEDEWKAFADILHEKTLKKKDMLLEGGQICNSIGFINSGVIREYAFENGKESTVDFVAENQFIVDFKSFIRGVPSKQYLEALTDTELVIFKKDAITSIYDKYKIWERFGRLIIEQVFCSMEEKRKNIIATSHEEQYRNFASAYPKVVQQVPQYYIASYLGLTPEHLSRIRKKV
jgi:CRP-like cAMP-binding protein